METDEETRARRSVEPYPRTVIQQAKHRKKKRLQAQHERIRNRREIDAKLSGEVNRDKRDNQRFNADLEYYEQHLRTIKMSLQRELNNDPFQYLERLYHEFTLWKNANCPGPSPLDHPAVVLHSLNTTSSGIALEIQRIVSSVPLWEKYTALSNLVLHLNHCVTELQCALFEEDLIPSATEETVDQYLTLQERHDIRRLKMFEKARLTLFYEAAGL
ncbi:hypothetical protein PQX77_018274 [Marasmius sp. AFHP31]|nr:hypothetical protein PQX77_018274 [Marasmius sp. AFHP31]